MRRIIVNTLHTLGYSNLTEAINGRDAIDKLGQRSFDLIITDWNMPVMDGITLTYLLKHSKDHQDIPILMVTTRSAQEDIVAAIKAGVNGYIVKPFSPDTLKSKIEQVLADI